jgi:hypothetical protein
LWVDGEKTAVLVGKAVLVDEAVGEGEGVELGPGLRDGREVFVGCDPGEGVEEGSREGSKEKAGVMSGGVDGVQPIATKSTANNMKRILLIFSSLLSGVSTIPLPPR